MTSTLHFALAEAEQITARARAAARSLAPQTTAAKDAFLAAVGVGLRQRRAAICEANAGDLARSAAAGRSAPLLDRLRLDADRVEALARAVDEVRHLPDPVGAIVGGGRRPNGLEIRRVRIPIGVIGMIYEARPNVTIDAAALAIKAGNAVVLRGGSDAVATNAALLLVLRDALLAVGLPADAAQAPQTPGHEAIEAMVCRPGGLDLAIPRGGTALIDAVQRWARVPVVQHYQGVCHVYVHHDADAELARCVVVNAKAQRPGVCNAMEALLIDAAAPPATVAAIVVGLLEAGVQIRACDRSRALAWAPAIASALVPAADDDFGREFLDLVCLLRVVDGVEGAIDHIARFGSGHTEAILCRDVGASQRFLAGVDASCVMINASTRFNDGGELGLGAEIGISTSKLHAYGPMGLEALTAIRTVVVGEGHVRV